MTNNSKLNKVVSFYFYRDSSALINITLKAVMGISLICKAYPDTLKIQT